MRRIVSEDSVSAEAQRGTASHGRMPESGVYIPNYRGVNQLLYNPGGSGQISFMNALAATGEEYMAKQQALYDSMEVAQTVTSVDNQYREYSEQFLKENPTGQGYTDYITKKYSEAVGQAVSSASSQGVKEKLLLIFTKRKGDVANNAFQVEKETYTAYAYNAANRMQNATLNEIMAYPSEIDSLSQKFFQQVETMRAILPAGEFMKYQQNAQENFTYSYGLGLIKRDPYQAQSLLKGEAFLKALSPNKYNALQKQAEAEIEHREIKKRHEAALAEATNRREHIADWEALMLGIAVDAVVSEKEIQSDPRWTDGEKLQAIHALRNEQKRRQKKETADELISDAIDKGEIVSGVTQKEKVSWLIDYWKNTDSIRSASNVQPLSYCEKINFLQENGQIFNSVVAPLRLELNETIKSSAEPSKIMDACLAVSGSSDLPAIKGLDKRTVMFAELATEFFEGSQDLAPVVQLRDRWLSVSNKDIKDNLERFTSEVPKRDRADFLADFYEEQGFAKGWFWKTFDSPDKQHVDDQVYRTIKDAYSISGDMTIAKGIAAARLRNIIQYDEDTKQWLINPPTRANTGYSDVVIRNIAADGMQRSVQAAEAAGFPIKAEGPFVRKTQRTELFRQVDMTLKDNGKIKVIINGEEVKRKLHLEHIPNTQSKYSVYYLIDESIPTTREYLYAKDGTRCTINFTGG